MAHPRARLSVFSRQLLVKRVLVDGWPVAPWPSSWASAGRPATSGSAGTAPTDSPVSRTGARARTTLRAAPPTR